MIVPCGPHFSVCTSCMQFTSIPLPCLVFLSVLCHLFLPLTMSLSISYVLLSWVWSLVFLLPSLFIFGTHLVFLHPAVLTLLPLRFSVGLIPWDLLIYQAYFLFPILSGPFLYLSILDWRFLLFVLIFCVCCPRFLVPLSTILCNFLALFGFLLPLLCLLLSLFP